MWNWQQKDWPKFSYNKEALSSKEQEFLHNAGILFGAYKHLSKENREFLKVELISNEALKTSEIEGEYLDRDSLQSSIRRHFSLDTDGRKIPPKERGIADLMFELYNTYSEKLGHETLYNWHKVLFGSWSDLEYVGCYRKGSEPMRIVSGPLHDPKTHFEAPDSEVVQAEMGGFIGWFNNTAPNSREPMPLLARAAITHLYFESIHPFEDGNGRIGRALAEKALAQGIGQPTMIAISTIINRNKKAYYEALESANKSLEITGWLEYFADTILAALSYTQSNIEFLIEKTKFFDRLKGKLNDRQEKCLLRIFNQGPDGFEGGLSAENYISITRSTRPTATRDLSDLVKKNALFKKGRLKSTRYYLSFVNIET
jgi:Fic family protein